jgi:alcohol dehydrogenase, propanol-preferring
MKACLLDRPAPVTQRPLRLDEAPEPVPAGDELLIEVSACGVCRTDLHVVTGDLAARRSPVIPGHQVVGRVLAAPAAGSAPFDPAVASFHPGGRVGVAWLHRTCGACRFCRSGRENLCERPDFTGWTVHGGFAERLVAPAAFAYPIPDAFDDLQAAPLLCAGIIGYRALRLCGLDGRWPGARLGIYGFGAAGHVAIQIARARGADVYVFTRDRTRHQALAAELGAAWVGGAADAAPVPLDAAIVFAPAGELVPPALAALDKGGCLVLGGIHMSPIPSLEYRLLYDERVVRSVANNTRQDGREFLEEAARVPVRAQVQVFTLEQANEALQALEHDAVRGAAVLSVR